MGIGEARETSAWRRPARRSAKTVSACAIRLYQQSDAEHLHVAACESVAEVSPWLGWCHPRYSLDEARDWIAAQQELAEQGQAFAFAIWREGEYLGGCGINQIN